MRNQTGLPSNLYAGDAVVLNNDRYTNYYLQQQAKKQAKSEALDQYYKDQLTKNVNPAGMRLQDIEGGFNQDVNDWREHYIQNADKIKNPRLDNGRAYNEHMSKYQQLLSRTQESKNAASQESDIAKAKLAGKYDPTDDDINVLHGIGSSIYSPEHYTDPETRVQPYGLEHLSPSVPEFDAKQQAGFIKGSTSGFPVKPSYDNGNTIIDKKAGKQYTRMYHQYAPQELQAIGNQAADLYEGSKVARKHFQLAMHDPAEYHELNDAYKKVYGDDATTPKQLAQGWALSHANKVTELGQKESKYVNPDIYYQHLGAREAASKRVAAFKKSLGQTDGVDKDDPIESLLSGLETDAKSHPQPFKTKDGQTINMYLTKAPDELKKALSYKDGGKTYIPDQVKVDDNGDYHGIFIERDPTTLAPVIKNGNAAVNQKIPVQTVTRDALKASLGKSYLTKKQNSALMSKPKAKKETIAADKAEELLNKYLK
jgi:hypothetical protein